MKYPYEIEEYEHWQDEDVRERRYEYECEQADQYYNDLSFEGL